MRSFGSFVSLTQDAVDSSCLLTWVTPRATCLFRLDVEAMRSVAAFAVADVCPFVLATLLPCQSSVTLGLQSAGPGVLMCVRVNDADMLTHSFATHDEFGLFLRVAHPTENRLGPGGNRHHS